jgi:predicted unusual protein kinase regulating ubiquinone biosynthesis (AarF/ABC1/UbiB family)
VNVRRIATLGALGATAAALVVWRRKATRLTHAADAAGSRPASITPSTPRTGDGRGPVSQFSSFERNSRLAGVGAKAGRDFAVHRARRAFASAERKDALDVEFEIKTAEQVTEALGQMKGALMKLGQMVSYLDQGLPEHVRDALSQLQQDAPPMSGELAAGVIANELGVPPEELFADWDPVPIASASIGQVHRAFTHDGRAVAVKVQYPGVDQAVASDLDSVGLLFAGMGQLFPGLDHKPIVAELRERLVEELDYEREAANQQMFADFYRGHPYIHVPDVIEEYSSRRVLTSDLVEGVGWNELVTWNQDEKNLAAETLYRYAFGSLYRLKAFNGDPHPGNYLFRPGGHVTFLDYGLVKRFTDEELEPFQRMIHWMVIEPDATKFREAIEDIGLLPKDAPFSNDEIIDYFGHFYEFVAQDGEYTITADYASETVRRFFDQRGPYGEIMKAANLPPSFVIINRINLGLYALFGELNATGNFRRLAEEIWPWVNGPSSTPMGDACAAWQETSAASTTTLQP